MRSFHDIDEYRSYFAAHGLTRPETAVTLGKFDGVHLGHQKLMTCVVHEAREQGLSSVVLALGDNSPGILSRGERAQFLEKLGIDVLVECPLNRYLMGMTPDAFLRSVLRGSLNAAFAAAGEDFRFGYRREGDAALLLRMQSALSYRAQIIEKVQLEGEAISSTRVRKALGEGDMDLVQRLLGFYWYTTGSVHHGNHIGTGMGMPTVNLLPRSDKLLPPDGVYATYVTLENQEQIAGVTNVGMRPTVNGTTRTIETTLLNYSANLYGMQLQVSFVRYIRPERKFPSLEALKEQVERDKLAAAKCLGLG